MPWNLAKELRYYINYVYAYPLFLWSSKKNVEEINFTSNLRRQWSCYKSSSKPTSLRRCEGNTTSSRRTAVDATALWPSRAPLTLSRSRPPWDLLWERERGVVLAPPWWGGSALERVGGVGGAQYEDRRSLETLTPWAKLRKRRKMEGEGKGREKRHDWLLLTPTAELESPRPRKWPKFGRSWH